MNPAAANSGCRKFAHVTQPADCPHLRSTRVARLPSTHHHCQEVAGEPPSRLPRHRVARPPQSPWRWTAPAPPAARAGGPRPGRTWTPCHRPPRLPSAATAPAAAPQGLRAGPTARLEGATHTNELFTSATPSPPPFVPTRKLELYCRWHKAGKQHDTHSLTKRVKSSTK